jgi:type I restriction enzyme R subunit
MSLNETDTRSKLIDPALHARGWTENLIRREETAGAIEIVDGKPRKRARGRVDYVLRVAVNAESQPVAVALIEAKAETMPPDHGLEQAKLYASCKRLNMPFVFSSALRARSAAAICAHTEQLEAINKLAAAIFSMVFNIELCCSAYNDILQ